jgi:outer membrane usher protein
LLAPAAHARDDDVDAGHQRAFLDLSVNGVPKGEALVVLRGADPWVEAEALPRAGVHIEGGDRITVEGRVFVRVASLAPRVRFDFDQQALALRLTVDPALLGVTELELQGVRPRGIEYRRDSSAFLNYAAQVTTRGERSVDFELGAVTGPALFSAALSHSSTLGTLRGPVNVTFDDRKRLTRWIAGDITASTGPLGGALQVAGLSLSKDFDLDPYFVQYPTVGFSGEATTPSVVDVYVNNQLVSRQPLPPGQFELSRLPVPAGAGTTRLVIRDAFGREREYSSAYYLTTSLLSRGLQQYQYVAGVERGLDLDRMMDYSGLALLANHRVGVTDWLTAGGRFEARGAVAGGGPLVVAGLGPAGEIELSAGLSRGDSGTGQAGSVGYLYVGRTISVGGAVRLASKAYETVSTRTQLDRIATDAGATVSSRLFSRGSITAAWQRTTYHGDPRPLESVTVTAPWQITSRVQVMATLGRTRIDGRVGTSAFIGLSLSMKQQVTASIGAQRLDGRTSAIASLQRSLPVGPGYGYRVQADAGDGRHVSADLQYQTRVGRYEVRQASLDQDAGAVAFSAQGAIVAIGGGWHPSRPVDESYALVRVPDADHVRAYVSNLEVGRTNRNGELLVPNLLAYYGNRLSIAPEDVPLDRSIVRNELTIAPPWHGGAVALFALGREWRGTGRLVVVREGRETVPAYGRLEVRANGVVAESPLGEQGEFYLESLPPGSHQAVVELEESTCTFILEVQTSNVPVVDLGVLRCIAR